MTLIITVNYVSDRRAGNACCPRGCSVICCDLLLHQSKCRFFSYDPSRMQCRHATNIGNAIKCNCIDAKDEMILSDALDAL